MKVTKKFMEEEAREPEHKESLGKQMPHRAKGKSETKKPGGMKAK